MADRDEAQVARWAQIRGEVGRRLRRLREGRSQASVASDLEDLGFHVTQSMVCRYEQGAVDTPLTLERMVGWALCCGRLSSQDFKAMLELGGYYLPWGKAELEAFDATLRHYRALPLPDQITLRRRLLWHILGLPEESA